MFLTKTRQIVKSEPATTVASRHIPFVEALWMRLRDAKSDVTAKEDYLRQVGNLGIRVESLTTVADGAVRDAKAVRKADADLERIKKLLALGCEPTTPPDWFCGHLIEPEKNAHGDYPPERWPQKSEYYEPRERTRVYRGPIPAEALRRYAIAAPLLDDARVYSPRKEDFRTLQTEPVDPVIIGVVTLLGVSQFFEVARWDIDRDLISIFGAVEK